MAITRYEIDSYSIYHSNEDNPNLTASIYCFKGDEPKGQLMFYKDGASIPASRKTPHFANLVLSFKENKLRDIVETLRLEKPLYIAFNDSNSRGYISTSHEEPVGEEEAAP